MWRHAISAQNLYKIFFLSLDAGLWLTRLENVEIQISPRPRPWNIIPGEPKLGENHIYFISCILLCYHVKFASISEKYKFSNKN
jgi:hypothetical protein